MTQPLISIVIPIYNVEKYLKRCLDSVLRQTYRNLEIICVNDGSTDSSLTILRDFQQKDPRIVVINKKNGGLSAARNSGLKQVSADYVSFIDSDDYVDPRYIEVLYNKLYSENVDFSLCNVLPVGENIKENLKWTNWLKTQIKKCSDMPINPNQIPPMAWGKLFRMDIIKKHNLQFPSNLLNEDNYWNFLYCAFSKRYSIIYEKLYFYREDNVNSIMKKTIFQKEHCYDVIKVCCRIFDSLSSLDNFKFYHEYLDDFFFMQLYYLMNTHKKHSIDKIFWNEIKTYLARSESAKRRFETGPFFTMLGDDIWE